MKPHSCFPCLMIAATSRSSPYGTQRVPSQWRTFWGLISVWRQSCPSLGATGRVLGGAIDFEQNTLFHWTSQTKIKVVFHRCVEKIGSRLGGFARAMRIE
jgi:hypothetical protein